MSSISTSARPAAKPRHTTSAEDKDIHTRVGAAIRLRRRAIDLTLQQLAAACGVSFQQVQKYEAGTSAIAAATLWSLACALDVTIGYFYERHGAVNA